MNIIIQVIKAFKNNPPLIYSGATENRLKYVFMVIYVKIRGS